MHKQLFSSLVRQCSEKEKQDQIFTTCLYKHTSLCNYSFIQLKQEMRKQDQTLFWFVVERVYSICIILQLQSLTFKDYKPFPLKGYFKSIIIELSNSISNSSRKLQNINLNYIKSLYMESLAIQMDPKLNHMQHMDTVKSIQLNTNWQ